MRAGKPRRMEDVAVEAGVSLATVSRVFSQPDMVSEETRERVHEAAARLRYLPNLTAGSIAGKRSRIVGALVPAISNAIFSETISGLSSVLLDARYELMLSQSGYDPDQELSILQAFLGRRVDGIVVAGAVTAPAIRELLLNAGTPVVETWEFIASPIDMAVGFSNPDAAAASARFLIGKGYRRLGFIGGTDRRSVQRLEGFRTAIREAGLPDPPLVTIKSPARSSVVEGGAALGRLLALDPAIDAVFCTNDLLAAGVLFQCRRRGLSVPGDIAVMGFSNLDISEVTVPALTTVHVGAREIGSHAARMILDRIAGEKAHPAPVDTGFSIIERQST
jgi:LacI family gluconate utilization system Gnt-I transcriptional repressor